jgi:hypothetical protein
MLIRDKATMGTSRKTLPNGFLLVDAVLSRTGIQTYTAGELGLKDRNPRDLVRVWRPAAEVFSAASIASFASVALTDDHPLEDVTPDNVERLAKGWVGQPYQDGDFLRAPITFSAKSVIDKLARGKDELSNGYDVDLEWVSGVVPAGERDAGQTYDAIQRNILGNHVALVDAGRCGGECRVLDQEPTKANDCASEQPCNCRGDEAMADKALNKKVVDGFGLVEGTDESFAVIDSLTSKLADATSKLSAAEGAASAAETTHAEAIAAKDAEIAELKAKVEDTAALDARVAARAQLITDARRVAGDDKLTVDGLSDLEIMKAAVTARQGEDKVKDKADTYFTGAFEFLRDQEPEKTPTADKKPEGGLKDAFRPDRTDDAQVQDYETRMSNRWKAQKKGA